MGLCELCYILEKRRFALERKLENKKKVFAEKTLYQQETTDMERL